MTKKDTHPPREASIDQKSEPSTSRRKVLGLAGTTFGVASLPHSVSANPAEESTVRLVEATVQYRIRDDIGEDWSFETSPICHYAPYYVDGMNKTLKLPRSPERPDIEGILQNNDAVVNFNGLSSAEKKANAQTVTSVVTETGPGYYPSTEHLLAEGHVLPKITFNVSGDGAIIHAKGNEVQVDDNEIVATSLGKESLKLQMIKVLDEKAPARNGEDESMLAFKTEQKSADVTADAELIIRNRGQLQLTY